MGIDDLIEGGEYAAEWAGRYAAGQMPLEHDVVKVRILKIGKEKPTDSRRRALVEITADSPRTGGQWHRAEPDMYVSLNHHIWVGAHLITCPWDEYAAHAAIQATRSRLLSEAHGAMRELLAPVEDDLDTIPSAWGHLRIMGNDPDHVEGVLDYNRVSPQAFLDTAARHGFAPDAATLALTVTETELLTALAARGHTATPPTVTVDVQAQTDPASARQALTAALAQVDADLDAWYAALDALDDDITIEPNRYSPDHTVLRTTSLDAIREIAAALPNTEGDMAATFTRDALGLRDTATEIDLSEALFG